MSMPEVITNVGPCHGPMPLEGHIRAGSGHRPVLLELAASLVFGLTVLVAGVVTAARTGATRPLPDLPQRYLPGHPLPADVPSFILGFEAYQVYFDFDSQTRIITRTVIPATEYTVGQVLTAWGTPSGMIQRQTMTYLFWDTRAVLVYSSSVQPDSRVEYILYEPEPAQMLPWRGFRNVR